MSWPTAASREESIVLLKRVRLGGVLRATAAPPASEYMNDVGKLVGNKIGEIY